MSLKMLILGKLIGLLTIISAPQLLHAQPEHRLHSYLEDLSVLPASRPALIPVWEGSALEIRSREAHDHRGAWDAAVEKKRLVPYMLAGAVVGGVLGYAVHEGLLGAKVDCDGDRNPFCPVTPYVYTTIGAGIGANVGALIGYYCESR
jgi:hypothetical protein